MTVHSSNRPQVAIAILHQDGQFLMQLRDDIPTILYPGHWALFGGHLEPGETTDTAIRRELLEEIGYVPPLLSPFGCYEDSRVIRHVYHGRVTIGLESLVLNEGADMDWLTPEEIGQGDRYSRRTQQVHPLGKPHQQILLDFMAKQGRAQ
jgi:8-oxo-dGTP pyrophosphatase MutT (NUDIX family)